LRGQLPLRGGGGRGKEKKEVEGTGENHGTVIGGIPEKGRQEDLKKKREEFQHVTGGRSKGSSISVQWSSVLERRPTFERK